MPLKVLKDIDALRMGHLDFHMFTRVSQLTDYNLDMFLISFWFADLLKLSDHIGWMPQIHSHGALKIHLVGIEIDVDRVQLNSRINTKSRLHSIHNSLVVYYCSNSQRVSSSTLQKNVARASSSHSSWNTFCWFVCPELGFFMNFLMRQDTSTQLGPFILVYLGFVVITVKFHSFVQLSEDVLSGSHNSLSK